ncbi:Kinesin light chain [Fusarium oxysporum f. sp. raphani]|nr:Kinesin light chain [Fusarium oxysporum f. sp. raphani]
MHYLPFPRNKNFIGREDVIVKLKQLLFTDSDGQRAALIGLGGMGKTQIALQLAHLVKNDIKSHGNCSVIWMPVLSIASFEQACTTIIHKFGIKCAGDEDHKETLREFLSSDKAGKWFLIVDNADDMSVLYGSAEQPGGIARFIPDSEEGRTLLITTRSQEVAVSVAQTNVVELPEMSETEAKVLLQKSLIAKNQVQDAKIVDDLLQNVTHLPLAITQASAYININKISIKYLRLFQNTDQDMVELMSRGFHDRSHYRSAQGAVATTWMVSFNQIRHTHGDASKLLCFVANIEPKAIPRTLLPKLSSEQKMTDAIGTLCGYNFLSQREDGEILDMHSLVHLATRIWNEEQGISKDMRQMTLERVAEAFPTDEWENRDLWRRYLAHALKLLKSLESAGENEESSKLGFWVGRCLLADGRTQEAVKVLEYVVAIRKKTLAEGDPGRLVSQHDPAAAYFLNGRMKDAMGLLEYVVGIWETTVADDYPDRVSSQMNLAGIYQANGQVKKAIRLLEHVVAIREKTVAEDHPHRLASQHNLARAYQANGQVKEALQLLGNVVSIREKTLPEYHDHRLASQHELALAFQANGQVKEAVSLLEYVVAIREKTLAEYHPERLTSHHNLALAYRANGEVNEAIRLLRYVVGIWEKTVAEDHPYRLASQHELAVSFQANGQIKEALALLVSVVGIYQRTLAEDHPDRLESEHKLAVVFQANGQAKDAVKLLEHEVAIREKIVAEDQVDRLISQQALAAQYRAIAAAYETLSAAYQALISEHQANR